jgi:RNA polymerase-binding protein DksA
MAKKAIPPKAPTQKATPAAKKSAKVAAPKKTVAKSVSKPVTKPAAAKKSASQQVAKKAPVKPAKKEVAKPVVAKPAARKCGAKMASPSCGTKKATAKPAAKAVAASKPAMKPASKTAAVKVAKPVKKTTAKPGAKPAAKSGANPVATKVGKAKMPAAKPTPQVVAGKKATPKVAAVPKKAAPPKAEPKKAALKKPAPPVVNNKTVKGVAAPARKAPEANPSLEMRRAYGSYDGIVVCETPGYFPEKTPYTEKELAALHKLLLDRRRHLLEVLRELDDKTFSNTLDSGKAYHSTANTHLFEGASDNMASDMALMVRQEEEMALTQVEAALERLEAGLFGVCVACGDKIGIPRLKAKPEAHLCISCKTVYDKKSRLR